MKFFSVFLAGFLLLPLVAAVSVNNRRTIKIVPWEMSGVSISAETGDGKAPKNLANAFTGKGEAALFTPFSGSRITLELKEPRQFKFIAIRQGTWGNWARINELGVSVDDGTPRIFHLADEAVTQAIPINATARKLAFTVRSTHPGKGIMPWGGIAAIGDAEFEPICVGTEQEPFPMTAKALEFELEASRPVKVPVTLLVTSSELSYSAPDLVLKPGENRIRVSLSDCRETKPFGIDWRACHIKAIELGADPDQPDAGFVLKGIRPIVPEGAAQNPWYDLGKFDPPTREIEGKTWTEGMSYSSSGRFGNSTYNGLLDEVIGDLWFHAYTGGVHDQLRRQKFDLYFDQNGPRETGFDPAKPWLVNGLAVEKSDEITNSWTHMIRKMKIGEKDSLIYTLSSLAPGFLVDSSRPLTVSSRGGGDIPKRSGAPNEDENRFFLDADRGKGTPRIGPTLVITPSQVISGPGSVDMETLSAPWIVAVWGGLERPTFWGDRAVAVLFTLDRGKVSWDRSGIAFPKGRIGVSTSFHGLFKPDWNADQVRERAALLVGMLRNYPLTCREFYRVDGGDVHIRDEFGYVKWGDPKFRAADFSPLPPIFTWGAISRDWGRLPVDRTKMIDTPSGPYAWTAGNELDFTLPNPVNRHAAFPRVPESAELQKELSAAFMSRPDPTPEEFHRIGDAWNTANRPLRAGASVLAASWLTPEARTRLLDTLKTASRNAFRDFAWIPRRELFSKRPYLSSLWVDSKVSPAMFGDIVSGIGAANYALYTYSKYSGDWEQARELWPRVLDSIRFDEVVNDWAIPMTSAREGILFGGIDMDTISFLGVTAAEQMARQVGTPRDRDRLTYLRAKIAPATALRFTFQNYLDPEGKYPPLWVNGFSESGPNLEWAKSTNNTGLDHVAMMFCWQGQQPEMYQFLMQLPGKKCMESFQKETMDKEFTGENFSGWRKIPFNFTRTAAHLAMRAWLGWDRAELERDTDLWLGLHKGEKNLSNAGFFSIFYGSRDRVFLTDWAPAALGLLEYDRDTRTLKAELASPAPFRLEGNSPAKIAQIRIDGREIPLPEIYYEGEGFALNLPAVNKSAELTFAK